MGPLEKRIIKCWRVFTPFGMFFILATWEKRVAKKRGWSKRRRFIIEKRRETNLAHQGRKIFTLLCWNLREDFFLNNCIIHPSSLPHTKSCNKKKTWNVIIYFLKKRRERETLKALFKFSSRDLNTHKKKTLFTRGQMKEIKKGSWRVNKFPFFQEVLNLCEKKD